METAESILGRPAPQHTTEDEIARLQTKVRQLEEDNRQLAEMVDKLREDVGATQPEPVDDAYSIGQFMFALASKRGRTYGWRIDYAHATQATPGCHEVTTDDIQKWQKDKRVPVWAVSQIDWLVFPARVGRSYPEWSEANVCFLIDLYKANPNERNDKLAEECTRQFGREINVPSIKGVIHRLGKSGRLPEHRPGREK